VSQLERLEQLEHEAELLKKMALYYTIRLRKHPVQFHWIKTLSFEELANDATDDSPIDMDAWLENFNTWKKK
jgi:hypothetical protein